MFTPYVRYFDFKGRSNRAEMIWFTVFQAVVAAVLFGIGSLQSRSVAYGLADLFLGASLIPSIAVQVRRLHDTGRSGWRMLWILLPGAGSLVLLLFLLQKGTMIANRFGPPLASASTGASGTTGRQRTMQQDGPVQMTPQVLEKLENLGRLRTSGALTEDEFLRQKALLLND